MLHIGIRALIRDDEGVLLSQLQDARACFPAAHIVLAACGQTPSAAVKRLCDHTIHYSDSPQGLTLPFHLLVRYAQESQADEMVICDGDDQFIFSELRRVYDMAHGSTYDAVIPIRNAKSLFFCDDGLDRVLVEDCENMIFRAACPNGLRDPQPGAVFLLNRKAIGTISLDGVPSWIGDIALTARLVKAGCAILETGMDIREQQKTNMTLDREMLKIQQMECYFGARLLDAIPDKDRYATVIRRYEAYIKDHERI